MIKIARFTFNPLGENTYLLIAEDGECVIVDAGCYNEAEQKRLADYIADHNLKPVMSLLTHAHPDHAVGAAWAKQHYNIPLALHSADSELLAQVHIHGLMFGFSIEPQTADVDLAEKPYVEFGGERVEIIHTPGHSQGCVCLYMPEQGVLISGDTLFAGSIGRTDLPAYAETNLTALTDVSGALSEPIMDAINGEISAEECLKRAQEEADEAISKAQD